MPLEKSSRVRLVLLVPGDMSVYMKSISGCLEGPHDKKRGEMRQLSIADATQRIK